MRYARLAAALAASVSLTITSAWAGDKEEAEKHFAAGVSLQKVEDFAAASAAFRASLRLYPTKSALFNLANCLRATHRYAEALEALERLRREYGNELEAPMRDAVERQTQELLNFTAELVVQVDQDGATVRIDNRVIGRTPIREPIRLSPGPHVIDVTLAGFAPARANIRLVSREQTTQKLVLKKVRPTGAAEPAPQPAAAPPSIAESSPPAEPKDQGSNALASAGWITTGAGAALLAGSAVTGLWALSTDRGLAAACTDGHCPTASSSDIDRLDTLATTTNLLLGAGLTVAAAGVVMLVLDRPAAKPAAEPSALQVSLYPGGLGALVQQRF